MQPEPVWQNNQARAIERYLGLSLKTKQNNQITPPPNKEQKQNKTIPKPTTKQY